MNQCIRLVNKFQSCASQRPVEEVKLASVGFFSVMGNLRSVTLKNMIFLNSLKVIINFNKGFE